MKRIIVLSWIFVVVAILFGCAPEVIPVEKPATTEETIIVRKESWEREWEAAIEKAKKEGKVTAFFWAGPEVRDPVVEAFRKKFGLQLETIGGGGPELAARLLRERRAGIFATDLMISGPSTLLTVLKPASVLDFIEPEIILAEVREPTLWYDGRLPFADRDKKVMNMMLYPQGGDFTINTQIVRKEEVTSWKDLLSQRWKGKISLLDPTMPGPGYKPFSVIGSGPWGWDYVKAFVKQEPVIARDRRLIMDWILQGKYAIGIAGLTSETAKYARMGAPVDLLHTKDPEVLYLSDGGASLVLFNNPPHPQARKVFANWILSREGQTLWSKVDFKHSAREDTPTDHLEKEGVRQPGVKYFHTANEDWEKVREVTMPKIIEIFGPLMK